MFALVNILVCFISCLAAHNKFVRFITCGKMGHDETLSWMFTWIIPVALHLGANALIATLIQRTPGYRSTFDIGELTLFLIARPRFNWFALAIIHIASAWPKNFTDNAANQQPKPRYFAYRSAFVSTLAAEFLLQTISLYVMGLTASFAANNGYYIIGSAEYNRTPSSARMMYGAALFFLIYGTMTGIITVVLILFLVVLIIERLYLRYLPQLERYFPDIRRQYPADFESSIPSPVFMLDFIIFVFAMALFFTTWIASWIFWAGFVQTAGRR